MSGANQSIAGSETSDAAEAPLVSPCVSICALNGDDVCIGCHRSGEEIRQWISLDNTERRVVLERARARGKVGNPFA